MSKLRTNELESLATGRSLKVDEIDTDVRQDLANPDKGAAMVARGVVAVDSIADLLALPEGQRREDLRYLIKGYYAGSDVGGGEFYWDSASTDTANIGTILGTGTGRFLRSGKDVALSDFGLSDAAKPIASTIAAINSGLADVFDIDVTNGGATSAFICPNDPDTRNFKINGTSVFSSVQGGSVAQVPPEFKVKPLLGATYTGGGRVSTAYDVSEKFDIEVLCAGSIKYYYVDPVNGTSGGTGTELDPMDRPSRAVAAEISSPSDEDAFIIYAKAFNYDQAGHLCAFPAGLVKPYAVKPWGAGRVRMLQGYWAGSRSWTDQGGGVWSSAISSSCSVFDEANRNEKGDPTLYVRVADQASLFSGSWAQVGGTIYVQTIDGLAPSLSIGIGRLIQNNIATGNQPMDIYFENVDFLGGSIGAGFRVSDFETNKVRLAAKNCEFSFSNGNGLEVYGHDLCITQNCIARYNLLDGFNYHSNTGSLLSESLGIEINGLAYQNGQPWSGSQNINNGTTGHDKCVMMRYGFVAFDNQGPNIVDVNDCWSYNFGCVAYDSRRADSADKADFDFSGAAGTDGAKAWLDCCSTRRGTSLYSITASSDCAVFIRNCNLHPSFFGLAKIAGF